MRIFQDPTRREQPNKSVGFADFPAYAIHPSSTRAHQSPFRQVYSKGLNGAYHKAAGGITCHEDALAHLEIKMHLTRYFGV